MQTITNYQITKQIYESDNSLVYRAVRNRDKQAVILKVLKENYPSPKELTRYRQEYDITRNLVVIDGVINAYSLEKYNNTLVMCLEDFGGESLKIWLDKPHSFSFDELLSFAIRATEILGQIQAQNIIHKDINPSNIILNPTTRVLKIIDFGISTQFSKQHLSLDVLEGTLAYMSPEQTGRMNRALDYRTDFYSLGATFYELFTGVAPFQTTDAMELVHCHIAKQPKPPIRINPDIPQVLSNIIMKLLEKTPEARYQSAWGIKADLETLQENRFQNLESLDFELAQKDISDRFQIPQKLYGRESEISTLLSAFERVANGNAEMMLVAGYSGIGKSVLVKEIYKSLAEKQGYFVSGKFDQLQRNIPYSAIVNAFSELVQQLLSETEAQLAQWKQKLLTAISSNGQIIIDVIPQVELIIGKQPPVPKLGPTESQNRFNLVFQNFMRVFCQPEHPLVIFLDDLQWVDSATLKLLELVMTNSNRENTKLSLFLIGAYRDNEVEPSHPLIATLDKLREEGVIINQITLKPLAFEHINHLIAETLHQDLQAVRPLTELVIRKTRGNPFFVNQFLQTLYEENLLKFQTSEVSAFGWQWDIKQIETLNITDNVVELMINKLKKLPQSAQQVLRLAACIGNHFDLDTLSVIYEKSANETFQDLMPVLREEFILPTSSLEMDQDKKHLQISRFRFLHDRVQQAAYTLIDDEQKKTVHLKIGWLLFDYNSETELDKKIFDIVDQLNIGIELIHEPKKREQLAQLNLAAGEKAKASAAYSAAFNYLKNGISLLKKEAWQQQTELTLKLHLATAEAAYLNGKFEEMEQLAAIILQHATTLLDKIKIYEIKIQAYMAQNRLLDAIDIARFALELLRIYLPKNPNILQILFSVLKTRLYLAFKGVDNLINQPEVSDEEQMAAMRILLHSLSSVYLASPKLLPILISKQIDLSLKYGHFPISGAAYSSYGIILCGVLGDIKTGYKMGELAQALLDKSPNQALPGRIIYYINAFICHWHQHLKDSLNSLQHSYQRCLETGDLEYAGYAVIVYCCNAFYRGRELGLLVQEIAPFNKSLQALKQITPLHYNQILHQSVLNLIEPNDNPYRLVGEVYNEEEMLSHHLEKNDRGALFALFFQKLILSYLFQKHPQIEYAVKSEAYIDSVIATVMVPCFHFYDSLARLAIFSSSAKTEQKRILKKVAANQKKMKKWAYYAPMNFQHKFDLVEAERARVLGNTIKAMQSYDKAIAEAEQNEYINELALAYELAGKFYLGQNLAKIAQVYLHDAYYAYQKWGAKAKLADLEKIYPQFFKSSRPNTSISIRVSTSTPKHADSLLDLNSIIKASRTISGEIVYNRLLEKMMHIVIENAGAEKGFLLLPQQNNWFIEVQGDSNNVTVLQSIALDKTEQVSANIIHYVARTQENVVLHDATQESAYQHDLYIVKHRPKSVLCLPLINHRQLKGILYLENNLTTGAFTPKRLEVLNLLSSQMAISLENSLLYRNLENKVAERTSELEQEIVIRKEAEKAAKIANQAKSTFLASMSHELRTPLNGILGFAQILQRDSSITAKQQHGLKVIEQSGNHLLALINDVLDLAKVESGKIELYKTDFHLSSLLNTVCEIIKIKTQEKGIDFYLKAANDLPNAVHGDERRLQQILLNLLGNAIKFTDQGSVTLSVTMQDAKICFKIEDTGVGISPENLETIFQPFEQVGEVERQAKGTGLGLAISKNLVELMGGKLCVSSQINIGTQFWFDLALPIVDYNVAKASTQQAIIGIKGKPPKILIVDDNSENLAVLIDILSPLGFKIESTNNGYNGLEIAKKWQPDAIITDLLMPEMDGFELIRQLRQSQSLKDKIIIASSASVYDTDKEKSLAIGSNAFLPKPIEIEKLLEQLQQHLNLTYIYGEKVKESIEVEVESDSTTMVFPSIAELKKLYELTLMADIDELEKQVNILSKDIKLKAFVAKMQIFLKQYQVGKLKKWLEGVIKQ